MAPRQKKSIKDFRDKRIADGTKKLGGDKRTEELLVEWSYHRKSEKKSDR